MHEDFGAFSAFLHVLPAVAMQQRVLRNRAVPQSSAHFDVLYFPDFLPGARQYHTPVPVAVVVVVVVAAAVMVVVAAAVAVVVGAGGGSLHVSTRPGFCTQPEDWYTNQGEALMSSGRCAAESALYA